MMSWLRKKLRTTGRSDPAPALTLRAGAWLVALLGFGLYANTLRNGYVFDDRPLFTQHTDVQRGWAGIPRLLTSDIFSSQYAARGVDSSLTGGRYRPLSLVTFAMEVATVGQRAWFSHLVNALLYAGIGALLVTLLARRLLPDDLTGVMVIAILFAAHPLHTEAVANVKGRDELLSMLFILLACRAAFRSAPWTGLWFGLALLSKEYAVLLFVLLPVWLALRGGRDRIPRTLLSLTVVFTAYAALRVASVGVLGSEVERNVLDHPYLLASPLQALATKLWVLLLGLKLMVWPHPLAYDYSFQQIPLRTFRDPGVWCAVAAGAALLFGTAASLRRRSPAAIGFLMLLLPLALTSNLFLNAGCMLGERLLFHPSLGACVLVGWAGRTACRRWPGLQRPLAALFVLAAAFAAFRTPARNLDWRDETTLYLRDVDKVPNSCLAQGNAGAVYFDLFQRETNDPFQRLLYLQAGVEHCQRALEIYPEDEFAQLNLGGLLFSIGAVQEAERLWAKARPRMRWAPDMARWDRALADHYTAEGVQLAREAKWEAAEPSLRKAVGYVPHHILARTALGGLLLETGRAEEADAVWALLPSPVTWQGFAALDGATAPQSP